jgi:hypothetical protein
MKTQTSYRYIQDPGHGWIEVPRAELDALEIAHRSACTPTSLAATATSKRIATPRYGPLHAPQPGTR